MSQSKLQAYCKSEDIALVAYRVLGSQRDKNWEDPSAPMLLEDPVLANVAAKYHHSPAEVAMHFILQKGIVVLVKSFTAERLKQNLGVFDFELMSEDMKTLEELDNNLRYGHFKQISIPRRALRSQHLPITTVLDVKMSTTYNGNT